jgi:hypothetical protein
MFWGWLSSSASGLKVVTNVVTKKLISAQKRKRPAQKMA